MTGSGIGYQDGEVSRWGTTSLSRQASDLPLIGVSGSGGLVFSSGVWNELPGDPA
jgi:hypothetical protein